MFYKSGNPVLHTHTFYHFTEKHTASWDHCGPKVPQPLCHPSWTGSTRNCWYGWRDCKLPTQWFQEWPSPHQGSKGLFGRSQKAHFENCWRPGKQHILKIVDGLLLTERRRKGTSRAGDCHLQQPFRIPSPPLCVSYVWGFVFWGMWVW